MWKHTELDKVQKKLLKQRIISIGGEVDGSMAMYVREALLRLMGQGSPDIKVLITSGGGSVSVGLDIYDAIRLYPGKTTGIAHGIASSMAAIILQGCTKRIAAVHSRILIHHISTREVNLDVLRDQKRIARMRDDLEKDQTKLYAILAVRTKRSINSIKNECVKDRQMTAEEALEFGLIDEIV